MNIDSGKRSASARVTLTVEMFVTDKWGGGCTVDQVHQQAADQALGMIRRWSTEERRDVRVIGTPKVEAIIVSKEA